LTVLAPTDTTVARQREELTMKAIGILACALVVGAVGCSSESADETVKVRAVDTGGTMKPQSTDCSTVRQQHNNSGNCSVVNQYSGGTLYECTGGCNDGRSLYWYGSDGSCGSMWDEYEDESECDPMLN
jgi:hypothetical protein